MDRPEDRLALIEVLDREGRVLRTVDVHRWPVGLGRGLDNLVVLDDVHVAAAHARIELDGDAAGLVLKALDSHNGLQVDGVQVPAGGQRVLGPGPVRLQLGQTALRLRWRDELLEPERALLAVQAAPWLRIGLVAVALWLTVLGVRWIEVDPGNDFTTWLPTLLGLPAVVIGWCLMWAMVSKVFQHRFEFVAHLGVCLPWFLGLQWLGLLLPQAAAALDWPWLWRLTLVLLPLGATWLVLQHLGLVLPRHRRGIKLTLLALLALWGGIIAATNQRRHDRLQAAPYMSTLPMPGLRLGPSLSPQALVDAMAPLPGQLADRVKESAKDDPDDGEP